MKLATLVVLIACSSAKDKEAEKHVVEAKPQPVVVAADAPAKGGCAVTADDDGTIEVNGVAVTTGTVQSANAKVEAVSYPRGAKVLVAWRTPGHYGAYAGSPDLFEVDCANPATKTVLAHGGDFGNSVLTGDGKTLYFSQNPGISALDLATKAVRVVTKPEKRQHCDSETTDSVTGLDELDDTLAFNRGAGCGFEGDYEGASYLLDHPAQAAKEPRETQPVVAIAQDGTGGLWASDGACANPAIAHSTDEGAHWQRLPIAGADTSPGTILLDAKVAGRMVVRAQKCDPGSGPVSYGELFYASRDAGKTWRTLSLPKDLALGGMNDGTSKSTDQHGRLDTAVELRDGSTEHLTIWAADANGDTKTWQSDDGGTAWKSVAVQPRPQRVASIATPSVKWSVSDDGVLIERGKQRTRAYLPRK